MAETEWNLINKNEPLNPGDRIRMYYGVIGPTFMMAAQVAAIEKKLESDPRFRLIRSSLPTDGWLRDIWFEILIIKPPGKTPAIQQASITGAVIGAVIVSAFAILSVFTWLSLKEVRLWMPDPKEVIEIIKETGWTTMKIAGAAVIGVIALKWWSK